MRFTTDIECTLARGLLEMTSSLSSIESRSRGRVRATKKNHGRVATLQEKKIKEEVDKKIIELNRGDVRVVFIGGRLDCMDGWEFAATGTGIITYASNIKSNQSEARIKSIGYAKGANYQMPARRTYLWDRAEMLEDVLNVLSAGIRPREV